MIGADDCEPNIATRYVASPRLASRNSINLLSTDVVSPPGPSEFVLADDGPAITIEPVCGLFTVATAYAVGPASTAHAASAPPSSTAPRCRTRPPNQMS